MYPPSRNTLGLGTPGTLGLGKPGQSGVGHPRESLGAGGSLGTPGTLRHSSDTLRLGTLGLGEGRGEVDRVRRRVEFKF